MASVQEKLFYKMVPWISCTVFFFWNKFLFSTVFTIWKFNNHSFGFNSFTTSKCYRISASMASIDKNLDLIYYNFIIFHCHSSLKKQNLEPKSGKLPLFQLQWTKWVQCMMGLYFFQKNILSRFGQIKVKNQCVSTAPETVSCWPYIIGPFRHDLKVPTGYQLPIFSLQ